MVQAIQASSGPLSIGARDYFVERDGERFRAFFAGTLKLGQLVFAAPDVVDGVCSIPLVTRPDIAAWVPDSVRKHVNNASEIEFIDTITYRKDDLERPPFVLAISTRSPFLGERLKIEARMTIMPIGETTCVHAYEGSITCRMFGFGGLVERMVRDSVTQTYKRLPRIIEKWNAARQKAVEEFGPGVVLEGRPSGIDCGVQWIQEYVGQVACGTTPKDRAFHSADLSTAISGAVSLSMSSQAQGETMRLRRCLHRIWIAWIDLIKLLFVVLVVVLLRFRFVRVTPSVTGRGRHRRKKSWEQFVAVAGHRKTGSGTIRDSEELLKRAHRRRKKKEEDSLPVSKPDYRSG